MIVERGLQKPLPSADRHYVTGLEVARASCGCQVYVGKRVDNGDAATVAWPCGNDHRKTVMVRFNKAMADTLPSQSTEPLIDVVARILMDSL